jgi:hypothetical protein
MMFLPLNLKNFTPAIKGIKIFSHDPFVITKLTRDKYVFSYLNYKVKQPKYLSKQNKNKLGIKGILVFL